MGDTVLAGKHVVILGMARQGLALARFLVASGATVTISDMAAADQLAEDRARLGSLPVTLALGGHPLSLLDDCDLLCLSGGVPPQIEIVQEAIRRGIPLSNDSLLTLQIGRERGLGPAVAVTGSSGKTTTTTLVGLMLQASGKTVHVGGNIGSPLIDRLDDVRPGDVLVLELSSFQLELFDPRLAWGDLHNLGPAVAAILNITPNHLDRHGSMAAYADAKFNLLRHLGSGAAVVLSADDGVTRALLSDDGCRGDVAPPEWQLGELLAAVRQELNDQDARLVPFSRTCRLNTGAWLEGEDLCYSGKVFVQRSAIKLRGEHNVSNLLAAAAISGAAGATLEGMRQVAEIFAGVPHRLEVVAEAHGVTWINDSIATSPERAIAGLRSFPKGSGAIILLAGGKDKKLPWDSFADAVLDRVDYLIGFGHAGAMVVQTVQERARFLRTKAPSSAIVQRLDEAVALAARVAAPGTIVLLSPGGTSYDAYRDFEERGGHFRQLVSHVTEWQAPIP